eukprot:CAMPEP_0176127054 /NCGR_PEP_ID=MMETSP0120_2-20121206/64145_1 /TAXON_ID=160619 /ORGANISM="Kryptoperidinium foliaceum, Strain CCMP 1326" /LENGTH=197 /DNA_ID=CAMNT_0017462023 /DNA_START=23 /DNA_END=613 /DNA_ORIENTATION=-
MSSAPARVVALACAAAAMASASGRECGVLHRRPGDGGIFWKCPPESAACDSGADACAAALRAASEACLPQGASLRSRRLNVLAQLPAAADLGRSRRDIQQGSTVDKRLECMAAAAGKHVAHEKSKGGTGVSQVVVRPREEIVRMLLAAFAAATAVIVAVACFVRWCNQFGEDWCDAALTKQSLELHTQATQRTVRPL